MGYYDDHVRSERMKKDRGGTKLFIAAISGGIIGALAVVAMLPVLLDWGAYVQPEKHSTTQDSVATTTSITPEQIDFKQIHTEITDAVGKVNDAVVGVVNIQQGGGSIFSSPGAREAGTGSGVVYKKENGKAYVVTNHHVIDNASKVEVSLSDGTRVEATVLGSDSLTDLAVLTIEEEHVKQVATFGNSDTITLGETVIAIGNPLGLEFFGSVTQGIISSTERTIPVLYDRNGQPQWEADVIQTDAAINPGNSGGALVNLRGEVIGINSMKIAQSQAEGIGFAIPINAAKPIIEDIEMHSEVKRPFMGIGLASLSDISLEHQRNTLKLPEEVTQGVVLTGVEQQSPADKAGLKQYDVIVKLDDIEVKGTLELRKYLYNNKKVGETMKVTYYRDGQLQETEMTLIEQVF